jgi:hypothetical protein
MYMYHRNGLQFKRISVIYSNDLDKILCDYSAGQNGIFCHFVIYNLSKTISMAHVSISLWNKCKLRRLVFFVDICSIHVHKEVHRSNQMVTSDDWCFERYTRDMMINVILRFERVQCISYNRRLLDRNMLVLWNNDKSSMYASIRARNQWKSLDSERSNGGWTLWYLVRITTICAQLE